MNPTTYQILNITCTAVFFGGTGLVFGYGWGKENAFRTFRNALIADEAARVNGFRTTFEAGVKDSSTQKKETSQKREAKI